MNTNGIHLPQEVIDMFLYNSPDTLVLFIHLVNLADPATGRIDLSLRKTAQTTGLSVKSIRNGLDRLAGAQLVAQLWAHPTIALMICDIDSYKLSAGGQGTVSGTVGAQLKEREIEKENEKENEKEKIPPHTPLLKEKEKEKEKEKDREKENLLLLPRVHEKFAEKFFDQQNHGALMSLAMELHRENPDTKGIREVQALANEIISQWLLEEYAPVDYACWVRHLRNTMRIKNRYNAKFKTKENPFDEYERRMLNGEYDVKMPDTLPF